MSKIFATLKTLLSRIRVSTLLSISLLFVLITLVDALGSVGTKWKEFQILLIFLFIGFSGLVIFLKQELDFVVYRISGESAVKIGFTVMLLGSLLSVSLVLSWIL